MALNGSTINIVYDHQCPFCNRYSDLIRLRSKGVSVFLHSARDPETIERFPEIKGFNLESAMLVHWNGQWFHGARALTLLSQLVRNGPLAWVMRYQVFSTALYPIAKIGRRLVLIFLGVGPILK
jgi:predicted DCC family thiol-disulfide oxidoreductase YuxK